MSDDVIDFLKFIGMLLLGLVALFVITAAFVLPFSYLDCKAYTKETGRETGWSPVAGCFAKYDGQWYHRDEIRVLKEAGNGE